MSLHIIADICTNHDGDINKAKKLIKAAHTAGASSVKFQIIYPEGLYVSKVFSEDGISVDNQVLIQRRKSVLSDDEYIDLSIFSKQLPQLLSGSVFDRRGLDLLDRIDAPYIKMASCDLNNFPFIAEVAERGRPIILSTGMAELSEVEKAICVATKNGAKDIILLHCVSIYPTPTVKANLNMIPVLSRCFGFPVGFSDHTLDSVAGIAAVALGATWIEKHFTLCTTDQGFDHAHSLPPDQFRDYIQNLQTVNVACQPKYPKLDEKEITLKSRARRGLYAARDLTEGELLKKEDILIVRPETSLKPEDLYVIINKKIKKHIKAYTPLSIDLFKN